MPTEWLNRLVKQPNAVLIPHGIETAPPRTEPADCSGPPLVVFQGRLVTTKGVRTLLEAANILRSEHRKFEMLLIGDGPERPGLEYLAGKLKLSGCVRFAGSLSSAELDSVIAKASIVVVPSIAGEVFGLVLAENMLRGLAIIASDLGCFVEILGEAGLTFRAGDASDLARQIARLLDDPALASQLRVRARQRISDFYSRGHMIEAHARLYRQVYDE